jgi:Rrf2 family protein
MIRISTKGRYGTRFMVELAANYGKEPILLKEIAKRQEISEGYLQHIVDALKGAGLVYSSRVGHGGYTLSRSPESISLRDILATLEGSINLVECIDNPGICARSDKCTARKFWTELGNGFSKSLEQVTLDKMSDVHRMIEQ